MSMVFYYQLPGPLFSIKTLTGCCCGNTNYAVTKSNDRSVENKVPDINSENKKDI